MLEIWTLLRSKCIFDLIMMTQEKPSRYEYCVTAISGLICIAFLIVIAIYCSPNGDPILQNKHNRTHVLPTESRSDSTTVSPEPSNIEIVPDGGKCNNKKSENSEFEHAMIDAKNFEQSIATKDTLPKRVWHRLSHREEASRAALILTALAILLFVAILLTKMWREKEHYPLTMKQVVSYPQDDEKSEILVKGEYRQYMYAVRWER